MARARGGDSLSRRKGGAKGRAGRARQVYIYTEGEVTEPEYIDIIVRNGTWARPDRTVQHHIANPNAEGKHRKPLRMVQEAVRTLRTVEREARNAGLKRDKDWNWPQVWVLFDRDEHQGISDALRLAEKEGIHVAYSHPCFELWRLLHYTNYTATFGGVCGDANTRLRSRPGFAATYGRGVRTVTEQQSKHVREEQVLTPATDDNLSRYRTARKYAQKINEGHPSATDPRHWDPYTDVWCFVEEGLLLGGY